MMLDHTGFPVIQSKLEDEVQFMTAALGHTGFKVWKRPYPDIVGMGIDDPFYWIVGCSKAGPPLEEKDMQKSHRFHVAFSADNQEEVDKFYEAAIKAGGKDNGKPGLRTHYHPNYYGAFVISPGGINIEVVNHTGKPCPSEKLEK